jgi:hypothetical protein
MKQTIHFARLFITEATARPLNMEDARNALYPEWLHLRVPAEMPAAVQKVARRQHVTGAQWIRATLLRSLAAEGVRVEAVARKAERPNEGI